MNAANPWTVLSSEARYDNAWIRLRHDEVLTPAGTPGIYGTVHFKNKALGIIPIDAEGHTWLVGQYRYPLGAYSWEIPMGGGPLGEDPLAAAQRELLEETGLTAARWQLLGRIHTSNSVTDEEGFIFWAEELTPGPAAPEETELLALRRLPLIEALDMVMRGDITDSLSVFGLLKLARLQGL